MSQPCWSVISGSCTGIEPTGGRIAADIAPPDRPTTPRPNCRANTQFDRARICGERRARACHIRTLVPLGFSTFADIIRVLDSVSSSCELSVSVTVTRPL